MISPLRRRHRHVMLGLAVVLPLGFATALASRPAPAVQESLPAELAGREPATTFAVRAERASLSRELPIALALGDAAPGLAAVRIDSRGAPFVPDALVYWSAAPSSAGALPAQSFLLGAVPENDVRVLALPAAAHTRGGRLLVFSAGWQRVVGEWVMP
jgi:hypothetical protein